MYRTKLRIESGTITGKIKGKGITHGNRVVCGSFKGMDDLPPLILKREYEDLIVSDNDVQIKYEAGRIVHFDISEGKITFDIRSEKEPVKKSPHMI
jgi:hypothetical protein